MFRSGQLNKNNGNLGTKCVIGSMKYTGIVDTGSNMTVISVEMLKRLGDRGFINLTSYLVSN